MDVDPEKGFIRTNMHTTVPSLFLIAGSNSVLTGLFVSSESMKKLVVDADSSEMNQLVKKYQAQLS